MEGVESNNKSRSIVSPGKAQKALYASVGHFSDSSEEEQFVRKRPARNSQLQSYTGRRPVITILSN